MYLHKERDIERNPNIIEQSQDWIVCRSNIEKDLKETIWN